MGKELPALSCVVEYSVTPAALPVQRYTRTCYAPR